MIEVHDLHKAYGSLAAVDGVTFDVRQGETFGLLGPNGAGKTTTMHLLVGVLTPDKGTIGIAGQGDPTRSSTREKLGLAPQSMSLYPDLTGEENLAFFAKLHGITGERLRARVNGMLDLAGLTDRRKHRVRTYSGGMQRRLNLACALVHDPPVLLLDEPTVGVDPQSRNHLFDNIEALRNQGRTILYTTHYMEEAQRLCDRVAIMDHGKILALDTPIGLKRSVDADTIVTLHASGDPEVLVSAMRGVDGVASASVAAGAVMVNLRGGGRGMLPRILTAAEGAGIDVDDVSVAEPTLETVFISLTGKELRD